MATEEDKTASILDRPAFLEKTKIKKSSFDAYLEHIIKNKKKYPIQIHRAMDVRELTLS